MDLCRDATVRTKVLKLDLAQDELFRLAIERLWRRQITVDQYLEDTRELLSKLKLTEEFAETIETVRSGIQAEWLVRRHIDGCRYTVQIYRVDAGEVHPPHHHHNLISTQVVLEGTVHIREYDRVERDNDGRLLLRLLQDRTLKPGDMFQASEWKSNVHWFCAVDGDALIFSVDARGFEPETFDSVESEGFGRRYLDPTVFRSDGLAVCDGLDRQEAENRFGRRPLTDFPVPSSMVRP